MDKVKILRLLDEADNIVSALYRQGANKDYKCKSLHEKLKVIAEEIGAQPKSNADRIRAMTDEGLSAFLGGIADNCSYNTCDNCPMYGACVDVPISRDKWLKQELSEDVE